MKFRFEAIDERGMVLRRVLRAESEEAAREALLAEGVFPKRIAPVGEEEKVSWSPKAAARELQERVHGLREGPAAGEPEVRERLTVSLRRGSEVMRGTLGIRSDNSVLFDGDGTRIVMERERVETARIAGFPVRVLRVCLLDGDLLEVAAGFLVAGAFHKRVVRALTG